MKRTISRPFFVASMYSDTSLETFFSSTGVLSSITFSTLSTLSSWLARTEIVVAKSITLRILACIIPRDPMARLTVIPKINTRAVLIGTLAIAASSSKAALPNNFIRKHMAVVPITKTIKVCKGNNDRRIIFHPILSLSIFLAG